MRTAEHPPWSSEPGGGRDRRSLSSVTIFSVESARRRRRTRASRSTPVALRGKACRLPPPTRSASTSVAGTIPAGASPTDPLWATTGRSSGRWELRPACAAAGVRGAGGRGLCGRRHPHRRPANRIRRADRRTPDRDVPGSRRDPPMSRRPASIRKEAQAALDAIAGSSRCCPKTWPCPRSAQRVVRGASAARATRPARRTQRRPRPQRLEDPARGSSTDKPHGGTSRATSFPGSTRTTSTSSSTGSPTFHAAKKFLRAIAPSITSMDEVLDFVRAHRALRLKLGVTEPPGLQGHLGQHRLLVPGHREAGGRHRRTVRRPKLPPGPGGAFDLPRRPDRSRPPRPSQPLERRRAPQ